MLERYRPAPVGTLWVDMPHVHPDVEPLGTVQDDAPEPPRAKTAALYILRLPVGTN